MLKEYMQTMTKKSLLNYSVTVSNTLASTKRYLNPRAIKGTNH
jgi:hypothetical protein